MLSRREFFETVGGGIAVLIAPDHAAAQFREASHDPFPPQLQAWLHIAGNGEVTVYTGKVEFGQGVRTSLAQAVAEELRTPLSSVQLVMGDTELTAYDMGTFGSRSTPYMAPQLRKAGAAARELLIELAAKKWRVDGSALVASGGAVMNPRTGQSVSYGALASGESLLRTIPAGIPLTPATDWKVLGTPAAKVDAEAIVTGRRRYPSDLKHPGMLYGKVVRPASFGARLASAGTSKAEAMPGVQVVHDGDFLAVIAPHPRAAERAAAAVTAQWTETPQPSGRELFDYLKQHQLEKARPEIETGSVEKAIEDAEVTLSATYTVAYIAHCPLETRAAVAQWEDDHLTVWTGSQRPFGVRAELATEFGMPEERVHVIVPDTGAGYGGKHTGDAAREAARLAKAAGKPVKVVWTRQEEMTWAYFRPAGVIEVRSATRAGAITAWEFVNINSGPAALQHAYNIPNQRITFQPAHPPLRQGSYRSLAAAANHFARESHIDEIAHAVGADPLQFRLNNTEDPRFRAVIEAAAGRFGWGKRKAGPGQGFGIAAGWDKGSYVATCVALSVEQGKVRLERIVEAFECGAIVNPDGLRNQVVGAIIMGLGGALFEAIRFANGRILNDHFYGYRLPRQSDVPPIETVLLNRKDLPSAGAGETPIVGIAPAIGNAIFAATGKRLRSLPLAPQGVAV
jgi:CO/xanthine dehydrogenase Mo-binding subunit